LWPVDLDGVAEGLFPFDWGVCGEPEQQDDELELDPALLLSP